MNEEDYSSDTSDEDYVPNAGEVLSEEEESGDEEDLVAAVGSDNDEGNKPTPATKRRRNCSSAKSKRKQHESDVGVKSVDEPVASVESCTEDKKKKADELWADFMKDVNKTNVKASVNGSSSGTSLAPGNTTQHKPNTVKVTQEFDFAGETVTVVKEVAADSKEAKQVLDNKVASCTFTSATTQPLNTSTGVKRPAPAAAAGTSAGTSAAAAGTSAAGGLSSVLGKIGKKPKISVLEKSKIDWDGFKDKEGIADELKIHNRGKDGYLERQAFLQRTDYRQFELERSVRLSQSSLPPTAKR